MPPGNPSVVDVTCELPRRHNQTYLCLPTWDTHGQLWPFACDCLHYHNAMCMCVFAHLHELALKILPCPAPVHGMQLSVSLRPAHLAGSLAKRSI